MRITDLQVYILEAPGDYGFVDDATEPHGVKRTCIFIVETDAGLSGCSQVETQPDVAQAIAYAPGESSELFSGLRALALGEDPLQVEQLWDRLFLGSYLFGRRGAVLQAISGIDIACWDILGKYANLPVATLLGGKRRDSLVAYASTLFRNTPQGVYDAARAYVAEGFRAVKFGWGPFGNDPRLDFELATAARAGVGADTQLMIDVGWRRRRTYKEALTLLRMLESIQPYWVEEPCFPEDYETYSRLADASVLRIAAGEAESTVWGFRTLAERGRVDVLQPDLSRCGGFTIARRIAYLADELNIMVCPHAWGSHILTAATLQFAAFLPRETFVEFNTSGDPISAGLISKPLAMVDGYVRVPDGPGLGVDPDMDAIRELQVRGDVR